MNEQLQQTSSLESSSSLDGSRTVVGSDNFAQNGVPPSFGSFVVEDLETPGSTSSNAPKPITASRASSLFSFSKRKATLVSATIALAVIFLTGVSVLFFAQKAPLPSANKAITETQDVVLKDAGIIVAPPELQGANKSLLINGDVVTKGTLKIGSAGGFTGTISIENLTDNRTYKLPDASGTLATVEQVQGLLGLSSQSISSTTNSLTILNQVGVSSLQGTPNQITVSASSGSVTLSTPQNIDTSANVLFGNLTLGSGGVLTANRLVQTGAGNDLIVDAAGDQIKLKANGIEFIFPTTGPSGQTICTTGISCAEGGGQAVLLASGAVSQDENTTFPSIFINKDNATGNLLQLQSTGTNRFIVGNTGNVTAGTYNGQTISSTASLTGSLAVAGVVTGGTYNGQTISSAANLTGTLTIQGANSLTLGTASTNTGSILFKGSGSANTLTLIGPTSPSTNTLTLPNETGTLCSTGSVCSGYAPGSSGSYIQNSTSVQTNANFHIQSASAGSIGGIIKGASSQTADLLQFQNSNGNILVAVGANGNIASEGQLSTPYGGYGSVGNYLKSSEYFDDTGPWITSTISVTGDVGDATNPAPNGMYSADKLVSAFANANIYQSYTTTSTGNYTFSVWVKTNSSTATVDLRIDSTGGTPVTGTAASYTASTTWQRLSVTQNITGSLTAVKPTIVLPNNATTIAAWGAQLIKGSTPGVYTKTSEYTTGNPIVDVSGQVTNGRLIASGDDLGSAALTLFTPAGGRALEFFNDGGAAKAYIDGNGNIVTLGTVTAATLNIANLNFSQNTIGFTNSGVGETSTLAVNDGLGGSLYLKSGSAFCFSSCSAGGSITLQSGSGGAADGVGGAVNIYSGAAGSTGTTPGGAITLLAGTGGGGGGTGGAVNITAGTGGGSSSTGGALVLNAGNGSATNGNGGSVTIDVGSKFGSGTAGTIGIGTNVATAGITIGNTSGTGTITLGQSTAAQNINIGSANATSGAQIISIGNGTTAANMTVRILSGVGTAGTGTLSLGNNTRVATIDVGNIAPAAARTITIGGGNSGVVDTINIGSGNTTVANGKTINIGNGVPVAGGSNKISIGTSGDNFAGTIGITIGSKTFADHTTLIQGGNANTSPSAAAVRLETHDSGGIAIGTNGHTGTITLGYSTASSTINIGNANISNGSTQTINIGAGNPSGSGGIALTMGYTGNAASKTLIKGGTCISTQLTNCSYQAALKLIVGSAGEIQIGDNPVTGYAGVDNLVSIGSTVGTSTLTLRSGSGGIVIPSSLVGTANTSTYLCRNSSNQLTTCSTSAAGSAFIQGGNAFGATGTLGTTDGNSLNLITNNTTRVTIDTSGNQTLTGNLTVQGTGNSSFNTDAVFINATTKRVGIGNAAPAAALEVTGDIYLTKETTRNIKVADSTTSTTAGAALNILGANGNNSSGGNINVTAGSAGGFNTGGALTVTAGTGFAGGQLTLNGGVGSFGGGATVLQGGNGTGSNVSGGFTYVAGGQSTGSASGGAIFFQTATAGGSGSSLNSLSTRMTILASGNVGIGDATPASLFTVGNGDLFQVNSSGAIAAATGITSTGNLAINTSQLYVDSGTGGVGIGTATLGLAKTVIAVSNSSTSQFQNAAGGLAIVNTDQTNNNWGYIYFGDEVADNAASAIGAKFTDHTNNYSDLTFATRSAGGLSTKLTIQANGNVGVGDTTPASLFTVGNGDLFQVDSSGAIVAVTGITTSGNIIPNAAGTINLGSTTAEFGSLFIGDDGGGGTPNGLKLGLDQDAILAYDETTDDRVELTGSGASLFIEDRLAFGLQTITLTDDGTANDTLTPTATYVRVDVDETANGGVPDLVISEASAKDGDLLFIVNNEQDGSHDTFTITTSTGVVYVPGGSVTLGPNDGIILIYMNDRWVTLSFADNT